MYAEFNIGTNINHITSVSLLTAEKKTQSTENNEKEDDAFDWRRVPNTKEIR